VEACTPKVRMTTLHPIAAEPEAVLFERWTTTRDELARDELVRRHMPLVRSLVRRYSYTSEPVDDLVQVACVGLLQALRRFDPSVGASFRAFATPTIIGELRRHFRDTGWALHLPRSLQERARAVLVARTQLEDALGRSPTIAEVAETTGLTREAVIEATEARNAYRVESLDAPAGDGGRRARRPAAGADDPGFAAAEQSIALRRAFKALPPRELTLLRLRFERDMSQTEIGAALGISQMHVSRLLRRALARIHAIVTAESEA
jgi:RNA polymerase sigma-B factor